MFQWLYKLWLRIYHNIRANNVSIGDGSSLVGLSNIYGCTIGNSTAVGPFVEIQKNVSIGNRCKISSHSFICEGVTIEDEVFIGHGVMFCNDNYPRSTGLDGNKLRDGEWHLKPVLVKKRASIGTGAIILGGITIGENAIVGAGTVVTRDVPPNAIVVGVPSRIIRYLC